MMLRCVLFFLLFSLYVTASLSMCPKIVASSDGNKISAQWGEYITKEVIAFEWAVEKGSFARDDHTCYDRPLFASRPNTMGWTYVRKSNRVESQSLPLSMEEDYRVILRITSKDGSLVWVSSDVIEYKEEEEKIYTTKNVGRKALKNNSDCQIDIDNQCQGATISPADKMAELYGSPQWPETISTNYIYTE